MGDHFGTLGGHFGALGALREVIFALRDHFGGPWEQQDGHEVANNRIFVDFGVISGLVSVSFWGSKCVIFFFISDSIFDAWDFQIVVFAWKVLQKSSFHENRF